MSETTDLLERTSAETVTGSFLNREASIPGTKNKYKINIINKISVHIDNLAFTNMIDTKESKSKNSLDSRRYISDFLRKDGKLITPEELPFHRNTEVDFQHLSTGLRVKMIFKILGIPIIDNIYSKADFRPPSVTLNSKKEPNNFFRIFLTTDSDNKIYHIHLLDPYHLVATKNYREYYFPVKDFDICMSEVQSLIY